MKLITTKDYLLLIDEEADLKPNNLWLHPQKVILTYNEVSLRAFNSIKDVENTGIIIAYYPLTKEAKKLDLPELPSPFNKEDSEYKLANRWIDGGRNLSDLLLGDERCKAIDYAFDAFIAGYKAAQSKQKQDFIKYFNELWKKFGSQ